MIVCLRSEVSENTGSEILGSFFPRAAGPDHAHKDATGTVLVRGAWRGPQRGLHIVCGPKRQGWNAG